MILVSTIISTSKRSGPIALRCCFHDRAFTWARENKDAARQVLMVPEPTDLDSPLSTLEDYLDHRGWNETNEQNTHGVSLLSHVLSAPLTLCYSAQQQDNSLQKLPSRQSWCFLGARAESTLPHEYWRECHMSSSRRDWCLDFVGPDIQASSQATNLTVGDSQLTMQRYYQGYFHDMPPPEKTWDGFLLFNPGLGHPNLKEGWLPTLKKLCGQQLWLTAHSDLDAERDAKVLWEELGLDIDYQLNPFASRIVYQDPFDSTHFVSPNKYIAWVAKES